MVRLSVLPVLVVALSGCASASLHGRDPRLTVVLAPADRVEAVRPIVAAVARTHGLPEALILGVIQVESRFEPRCRSPVGARGLMQLMPGTAALLARRLGLSTYDIHDPAFNIEAGTVYLVRLLAQFDGRLDLALAAYHTGPARVSRWQRDGQALPEYSRRYVAKVLAARDRFLEGGGEGSGSGSEGGPVPGGASEPAVAPAPDTDEVDRQALRDLILERDRR